MLAVALVHSRLAQRAFLPYIVASQTIPILAVAPMVVVWLKSGWQSVAVIAAYLTFFPVTINTLRGLQSAEPRAHELMRSYAASRWQVLWRLRVPTSLPYLFTALKISATASVVGAIIGELPSSIQGGLGGAILNFNQYYSITPANLWATNLIAAALGIAFFVAVVIARSSSCTARRSTSHEHAVGERRSINGLTKTFTKGNVTALQEIDLADRAGRVRLADRAVRLREVDAAARDRRPDAADRAARSR